MQQTTPPDMTQEQRRELKELKQREARLARQVHRQTDAARRRLGRITDDISRHYARLLRELGAKQNAFAKPLRAEGRALRTLIHRASEGRTETHRELRSVTKRIAILEGRQGV